MKFLTSLIFVSFAVSAVMAKPSSKLECSIDNLSSCKTDAEIATAMGITEADVRQRQDACGGHCITEACPWNC
ncbi:uncharacterized protein BYT42DRAFT_647301 [Radiomyces spectabilis]|uniref:uncharacterized protein n=1 Tax=Radiomyces spectabilis TaxID=64574 RepID=UPI00221F4998|nr:uncharacterized protein BYT42DRAFT_647301 [Radiomyces spectabilis]KAI8371484.1 hypothetical protein BYT42DRAFT_647301 [Radiomyces spectabilis]